MGQTDYLRLSHLTNKHWEVLNSFELSKEQGQFTSLPNNYKEVTEGQYRIVILKYTEPVGFFFITLN